ncbi:serine/threonine protein kinase [Actinospica sp. MGRD01-02]|uniref:non-specific serine/threonine protein kinase n=1 Tax=Actinospica acidithermotolerans TaxID=2828514 RepID=A0A941EEQ7_9ACTN|nr:protein kinase [Actinospica acidithermotolerans]MBR7829135.1 serine/threonine protein kinase [Actinospica acidithermotolerans]
MSARLGGRYELGMVLGAGGMARVYAATDLALGRQVAVKVLDPGLARDPEFIGRFAREARTAAMLPPHAGIVTIFDSGQDAESVYLVMELVSGRTLAQTIDASGRIDPASACRIAIEVCQALSVAHGAGLVHRDIKPANIMITDSGTVKVVDFGIARAQAGDALTRTGAVLGSPAYMSPEQITGGAADARSDLYALGAVLHEMLTGSVPFPGEDQFTVLTRHLNEVPTPPSALVPGIPPELDHVVATLMAKNPNQRPATADQAAQLLAAAAQAFAPAAHRSTVALTAHDPHPTRPTTALPPEPAGHRSAPADRDERPRTGLIAGVVVGAVAVVGIAIWALSSGSTPAPSADSAATRTATTAAAASTAPAQIDIPTTAAAATTATTTSSSPAATTASASPLANVKQALTALQQTVTAQAESGGLGATARRALNAQLQNMRQSLSQAQTQVDQNPQNQTQVVKNLQQQFDGQIKNMRQELTAFVEHNEVTAAAKSAIGSALDGLQQSFG